MNYTKGEWKVMKWLDHQMIKANVTDDDVGEFIADCGMGVTSKANANLIALTPELYEICEQLADWDAGKFGKESKVKIIEISKRATQLISQSKRR